MITNFYNTIIYLIASTFFVIAIMESVAYIYFNNLTLILIILPVFLIIAYGFVCYKLSNKLSFGLWKYIFFIPFINVIMYILLMYTLPLPARGDDDFGLGFIMLPLSLLLWIVFLVFTITGIKDDKKSSQTN